MFELIGVRSGGAIDLSMPAWMVLTLGCSALALAFLLRAAWRHGVEERAKPDNRYHFHMPSNWPKRTRERDAKLHGLILTAIAAGSGVCGYRWVALACVVIMVITYVLSWWSDFAAEQLGYDVGKAAEEDACWQDRPPARPDPLNEVSRNGS